MYTGTLQTFFFIFTYKYTGNVEILFKDVVSLFLSHTNTSGSGSDQKTTIFQIQSKSLPD